MKNRWQSAKLNELGFVGRGKSRHRPRNDPILYGGPYPFFQTGDVKSADLYLHRSSSTYNEIGLAQSKIWEPGTLCITIAANIADSAILSVRGCFPDSVVGFVADPGKADTKYIKYVLDTLKFSMESVARGTTQDNLSLEKLLSFDFWIPDIFLQQRIASILSAYDDLIENNTRRIAILEEMARLLYEEWFVHFRFPGHENTVFADDGGVSRPEGWQIGLMADFVELKYGKALKASDRREGPYPVFGSSGVVGTHNTYLVEGPGIVVGRKGNVGSVFWSDEPFFPIDTVFYVESGIPKEFLYFDLQRKNFINNDAAVPGLSRRQANALCYIKPREDILIKFVAFTRPTFRLISSIKRQNTNLRTQRDLLLPKLVSGEIDVAAAEEAIEEAAA